MKKVYISGPYTLGDVAINVRNAIEAGDRLIKEGFIPYLPHLTHFWHLISPHLYEEWLILDLQWIGVCDAVLRLPGESAGADREVDYANNLSIPIFFNFEDLVLFEKWSR